MRAGLFALAAGVFAAAFLVAGAGGNSSLAQESVTVNMGPTEGPDGGGDQTGTVTLNAMDGQTEVVVDIDPSPDGADVEQPAHIHAGSCDNLGAVEYPLENVVNGQSTTVVDVSLADLQADTFAINVHKSGEEIGVYTSCGDIPAAAGDTPSPTATAADAPQTGGPTDNGSTSTATYLLLAIGAVAIAGSGALIFRFRRI